MVIHFLKSLAKQLIKFWVKPFFLKSIFSKGIYINDR